MVKWVVKWGRSKIFVLDIFTNSKYHFSARILGISLSIEVVFWAERSGNLSNRSKIFILYIFTNSKDHFSARILGIPTEYPFPNNRNSNPTQSSNPSLSPTESPNPSYNPTESPNPSSIPTDERVSETGIPTESPFPNNRQPAPPFSSPSGETTPSGTGESLVGLCEGACNA